MTEEFVPFAERVTGHSPHPWQIALGVDQTFGHRLIRIPTGFGKTLGVATAWLYHRVVRQDLTWPTRLVWMLPMRTLVEQTEHVCRDLLGRASAPRTDDSKAPAPDVHVLMGGACSRDFHLEPGKPAILVGTQDMLLSRALNRGYGAGRGRWPIDFGLLSQDVLWVLDEVQLMGVGFTTALQLAAFRDRRAQLRPSGVWAMSATLQASWLRESPDTQRLAESATSVGLQAEDRNLPVWTGSRKPVERLAALTPAALATDIAHHHAALGPRGRSTLIVVNTVERARILFAALRRALPSDVPLDLVHSRFRGVERRVWRQELLRDPRPEEASRVLVATQVVEAGVDLSADLLVTEVCPWPSLVQRLGRLARRGGTGRCVVVELDTGKHAAPYEGVALDATWSAVEGLSDLSASSLEAFEQAHPELLASLYPYQPSHLLLEVEVDELFDTTPDLSGGDLDVSRFIRDGVERDVSVAWIEPKRDDRGRAVPPGPALRPARDALCAVPFLVAQEWLCDKKRGGRLRDKATAYVWDFLEGRWRLLEQRDLRPGALVLVDAAMGGYDVLVGFDPKLRTTVPVVPPVEAPADERASAAADDETLSEAPWQTIAFHGASVARETGRCLPLLNGRPEAVRLGRLLHLAARWHDLGKAHPAFQAAIEGRPDARGDIAKAPPSAWARSRWPYRIVNPPQVRKGFRHELASALALFDVLVRWAAPSHPARLGELARQGAVEGRPPERPGKEPSALEREVLEPAWEEFDLVAYLVMSHHGKLRARLHATSHDQDFALRCGDLPIQGVREGDELPAVELSTIDGRAESLPAAKLTLEPAMLGLSPVTGRSWTERVDALRARWGPFALAYLEALFRAADVRASRDATLVDPTLAGSEGAQPGSAS